MNPEDLPEFLAENVPGRCTLGSALIEHAASQRGLPVRRRSRTVLDVGTPAGTIPFEGLNGPDNSTGGWLFRIYRDGQHRLFGRRGVPAPRSQTFAAGQPAMAFRYAARLGASVTVRPARRVSDARSTSGIRGEAEFRAAWRRAARAYQQSKRTGPILVMEDVPGATFHAFVVGDRAISVTQAAAEAEPSDVTDVAAAAVPALQRLAVDAVSALPGLVHADVEIAGPELLPGKPDREADYVATYVDSAPTGATHRPAHQPPKDIGGAVIEHYLGSPGWLHARRTGHPPRSTGRAGATEPLFLGTAPAGTKT